MKEYKYTINGNKYNVTIGDIEENIAHVEVNGVPYTVEMEKAPAAPKKVVRPVVAAAAPAAAAAPEPAKVSRPAGGGGKSGIKSPLPGVILQIKVNVGDEVKRGQVLMVLEAMKMENNIPSDRDGKVVAINVSKGDSILEGTDLIVIE
ncbi:MAG: biotin/lipoyl-binding protein [Bacteroidaceae bacterium]|jgi:biotin carboxyl carrier protein|nr:biotin/lipoyl-binding protein [Bacteroidaceae bacterium]